MKFHHGLLVGGLKSFRHQAYSSSAIVALVATGVISLTLINGAYNATYAAEATEIAVAPSNFSSYVDGNGDYIFKVPNASDTTYVFYNHGESSPYPVLNRLTIDHPDIALYVKGQNRNIGQSDSFKVNQFVLEDGALTVDAGPGLTFEVDRFFQNGGRTQISSAVTGQVGLKANNVTIDMLTGSFNAVAKEGTAIESDLALVNGSVIIETSVNENMQNTLPVGWRGNVQQSGGRLNIYNLVGTSLTGNDYIMTGGNLNVTALNPKNTSHSTGILLSGRFSQTAGSNIILVEGNNTAGIVLQGDGRYILSCDDSQIRINAQKSAVGLNTISPTDGAADNFGEVLTQNGGNLSVLAKTSGKGMYLEQGGVKLNRGVMSIDASEGGAGIEIANNSDPTASFMLNEGSLKITATNQGSAGLKSERVIINGGAIELLAKDNAKAIDIGSGRFDMRAGNLYLRQDSKAAQGFAIYGDDNSNAFFGKDASLETTIDLDAAKQVAGLMSFGNVTIESGSKLKLNFANTATVLSANYGVGRNSPASIINAPFLESRSSPIEGQFDIASADMSGETLFYNYRLELSDNRQDYRVVVAPKSTGNGGDNTGASTENGGATGGGNTGASTENGGATGGGNTGGGTENGGATDGGNTGASTENGGATGGGNTGASTENGGATGGNTGASPENGGATGGGDTGASTENIGSTGAAIRALAQKMVVQRVAGTRVLAQKIVA